MSHQEEISARTDELTNAVQSVVETFQPYRADHRPDLADYDRWLIWNDRTSERLELSLWAARTTRLVPSARRKALVRSRAIDLLRNAALAVVPSQVGNLHEQISRSMQRKAIPVCTCLRV